MLEASNGGGLFGNSPGVTARKIALLGINAEITGAVEKTQILASKKYVATVFPLSSDRR